MEIKRAQYSSPGEKGKRGFEDLDCYQLALDVIVNAHEFARRLPPAEKFDLAVQVRRSSKSITANIAEGYGRFHYLDSLKFYSNARGSLNETLSHFINARVLEYIDQPYFEANYNLVRQSEKALNGYMNFVRRQNSHTSVHEESAAYDFEVLSEDDHSTEAIDFDSH